MSRIPHNRRGRRRMGMPLRKRPSRWIDCNSTVAAECQWSGGTVPCTPNAGRDLVFGDLDMDWSDKSEVVLGRIVGDVSLFATSSSNKPNPAVPFDVIPNHRLLVRLGVLVREEVDSFAGIEFIDLFDNEAIEEYEWMYLQQTQMEPRWGRTFVVSDGMTGENWVNVLQKDIHLDIRVKRKLGKKDHLVLCHQWAIGPGDFNVDVEISTLLRTIMLS